LAQVLAPVFGFEQRIDIGELERSVGEAAANAGVLLAFDESAGR